MSSIFCDFHIRLGGVQVTQAIIQTNDVMIILPANVLAYVLAEKSTSFQVSLAFHNMYVQFNGISLAT